LPGIDWGVSMSKNQVTGSCLCGAVTLTATVENEVFDACHCGMCRKWSGGPIMTVDAGSDVQFQGEDAITVYSSSDWAERGFCRKCGTHLFYRLKQQQGHFLPVGLLDNTAHYQFHTQIFIDMKPKNYSFANETEELTQADVFAKHGG
jgi:hypothetical protein